MNQVLPIRTFLLNLLFKPCCCQAQVQVLSRLDYCSGLLAGLLDTTVKLLELIQNVAVKVVFNKPKRPHVAPQFINLQWLPVAVYINFKTLMFASTVNATLHHFSFQLKASDLCALQKLAFYKGMIHCDAITNTHKIASKAFQTILCKTYSWLCMKISMDLQFLKSRPISKSLNHLFFL